MKLTSDLYQCRIRTHGDVLDAYKQTRGELDNALSNSNRSLMVVSGIKFGVETVYIYQYTWDGIKLKLFMYKTVTTDVAKNILEYTHPTPIAHSVFLNQFKDIV